MPMHFLRNQETGKIEIHTGGKSTWLALPADVRDTIKRYCNFSRNSEAWISKGPSPWWLSKLPGWGFEDRGTVGEKLTLGERIEAKQERAAERADRYEDRAHKATAESNRLYAHSHALVEHIPPGQPILVGHHSEKRHRRTIDRSWNALGNAVAASEKAEYYSSRAETAARTAEGAQLKNPIYLGNRIKERETDIRTYERRLEGKTYVYSSPKEISDESRALYTEKLTELRAELAFFQKCMAECGVKIYTKESLQTMTHVLTKWGWSEIIRLNPKSVSCVNTLYQTAEANRKWPSKYDYTEVKDAERIEKAV